MLQSLFGNVFRSVLRRILENWPLQTILSQQKWLSKPLNLGAGYGLDFPVSRKNAVLDRLLGAFDITFRTCWYGFFFLNFTALPILIFQLLAVDLS